MDIRRYFGVSPKAPSGHNTRKQSTNDKSREDEVANEKVQHRKKSKSESGKKTELKKSINGKRKRVAYVSESSDSEDVEIVAETPSPKKDTKKSKVTVTPKKNPKLSEPPRQGVRSSPRHFQSDKTKPSKPEEKRVKSSAIDFFGSKKVTSGSKEAPKTISSKLAKETKKVGGSAKSSTGKLNAKITKDEIIILDSDWSDDESFAQLIDSGEKTENHKDINFNKTLDQLDKSTTSPKSSSQASANRSATPSKAPAGKTPTKKFKDKDAPEDALNKKIKSSSKTVQAKADSSPKSLPGESSSTHTETPSKPSSTKPSDGTNKSPIKSATKSPSKPSTKSPQSSKKKGGTRKYQALPLTEGKRTIKEDHCLPEVETPRTKARRVQEETPDITAPSNKPKTPEKSTKVSKAGVSGKTFVLTGQLESLERDAAKDLIVKHGGRVVSAISGKVNYVVAGEDSGVSKLAKAEKVPGLAIVNETEFYDLLGISRDSLAEEEIEVEDTKITQIKAHPSPTKSILSKTKAEAISLPTASTTSAPVSKASVSKAVRHSDQDLLWVEKYKPVNLNRIIGQTGDKSNANKLLTWLKNWHRHKKLGTKPVSSFGGFGRGDPSGAGFRAALLSGPPGIGKTTSAVLVCKEAGFSFIETNASDSRGKKMLQETVGQALGNTTMMDFMGERAKASANHNHMKHCIIMDEVDGMAGNEDRGGMQELIQLIKNSHIPVICICNDRQSQKIRSLANHCFDLRFQRPRVEQIKAAMKTVCFKEGINIDGSSLNDIIESSNHDIRQILHNLSVWSATDKNLQGKQMKDDSDKAKKDFKIDAFTACRMAFSQSETSKMSLKDKSDLFFYDYSLHPLFMQENYIHATPHGSDGTNSDKLRRLAKAAKLISTGDVVSKAIRTDKWSLLPMQAMFSSVLPAEVMMGHLSKQLDFPKWLGKFSTTNKNLRLNKEIALHMSLNVTGSARHVCLDYLPILRDQLTVPLTSDNQAEGIGQVVGLMEQYDLLREDYDSIMELTQWPGQKDLRSLIQSKTKAAFTRQYNKSTHKLHYSVATAPIKKRRGQATPDPDSLEDGMGDESDGDSDEEVINALKVQPKKSSVKTKASTAKPKASTAKPKAPAKTKANAEKSKASKAGRKK